jgi:4-hydroxybenzoate polyprenyltransferase/phosphoserine phosphatase
VVDLDGTLILTDSLHEQIAAALFSRPRSFFQTVPHLLRGRASVKAALSNEIDLSVARLPLYEDLVVWLQEEVTKGREIHICSAAHQSIVDGIASRIGIFKTAVGSDTINLKGEAKADYLAKRFPCGFVYVGDSFSDLAVWRVASGVVLANAGSVVSKAARGLGKPVEAEFPGPKLTLSDSIKALRVHHWSKNALIFVPLILGHLWTNSSAVADTLLGLICLLLVTSGTYLVNDIADLDADRLHWSKRARAIASGKLSIAAGFAIAAAALVTGLIGAFILSSAFALTIVAYLVLTLGYSFGLKRVPILDTFIIGTLFTTRLVMGIALLHQSFSEWLLAFSMFFFFSLAMAKRHTEIVRAGASLMSNLAGRGYRTDDAPLTLILGVSSSIASLLILILFIVEEVQKRNLYAYPKALWGMPVILALWVGRIWLLSHRGEMKDDPVSFALRDKVSLCLGLAVVTDFILAI